MEWKKVCAGKREGFCIECGLKFDSAFYVGAVNGNKQLCVECAEKLDGEWEEHLKQLEGGFD